MTRYYQSFQSSVGDVVGGTGSGASIWDSQAELKLQSKLVSKIKNHDFNLAVNVAQGRQTVDLVVSNIGRIGRSLVSLKHGNFEAAARQLSSQSRVYTPLKGKDISGRWLELQYGWLPLLSDSHEAMKAFAEMTAERRSVVKVSGSVAESKDYSASPSGYYYPGSKRTTRTIVYEMEEQLSVPRSLGLLDPLSVAWELIPYSFVLDWFLPIGTYLENLGVIPFLRGRFRTTTFTEYAAAFGYAKMANYKGARRTESGQSVTRAITTGLNAQRPTFVGLPAAMSPRRIFSAISLFHQRLK
jgi:hypothetical protein